MPWVPPTFWKSDNIWAAMLKPASLLYGRIQQSVYHAGAPYVSRLPVICAGNVQLGGSGKTPIAQALCRLVVEKGIARNPVVLLRGYGGRLKGPSLVDCARHSAVDVGDEALLHAHYVPTIIARNRASGARLAEAGGHDLIIMDDGLQNNQLAKSLSFLVFNSAQGLGNEMTFPAGPLRETLASALDKVSGILRVGETLPFETNLPVFDCALSAAGAKNEEQPYLAFCGIGHPDKFRQTLIDHHYNIVHFKAFADHQTYTDEMIDALRREAASLGARLITTEKDAMRIKDIDGIAVLKIEYRFNAPDALAQLIREALR